MPEHNIDSKWIEAMANSYETQAQCVNEWIDHTDDLLAMFEHIDEDVTALRGAAGVMRSRRDDFMNAATKLRAERPKEQ